MYMEYQKNNLPLNFKCYFAICDAVHLLHVIFTSDFCFNFYSGNYCVHGYPTDCASRNLFVCSQVILMDTGMFKNKFGLNVKSVH